MRSFKLKMLLFVLGILVITTSMFMLFTQKEVEKAMLGASEEAARHFLSIVELDVKNQYENLVAHKEYSLERYKQQLKNVIGLVESHVDSFYELFEKGILTEEQAKEAALRSVEKFRFANNDYFYIYDQDMVAISHASDKIRFKDMSEFQDVHGKYVVKSIMSKLNGQKSTYDSFWWTRLGSDEAVEKLSFNIHYDKWNWMIGTGVYIDDIEEDAKRKYNQILDDLKRTFSEIRIGKTGYFFLFDSDENMLIHPKLSGQSVADLKDVKGEAHIQNLIEASQNPDVAYEYMWDKPDDAGNYSYLKESYVHHVPNIDWYISSSVYKDEMALPVQKIIQRIMIIAGVIFLLSALVIVFLVKRFTRPIQVLTDHAVRLADNDFSSDNAEGLVALAKRERDETGRLAKAFIYMEETLKKYISNLKETTAENERIQSELRIAHDIQMQMVPQKFPAFPDRTEIDLHAVLEPAKEVGGDLYDYFFVDDEKLVFFIGDVSDKGVPAALFMARSKSLLRSATMLMHRNEKNLSACKIVQTVNEELCQDNDACMFLTLFFAILNVRTGEVNFCNAGHNFPYILNPDGSVNIVETKGCPPVGVMPENEYKCSKKQISAGDTFVLFTDGVTEAMNERKELYSEARLERVLMRCAEKAPEYVTSQIVDDVRSHSAGVSQTDDITMLVIKYFGSERRS